MLLYIRDEGRVGKSCVVKAIELGFSLLKRRQKLMIAAPTGAAASNIGGNTIHAALSIKTPGQKASHLSNTWTQQTALIIDEVSMIHLNLLATIDSQLRKAKENPEDSTAFFDGLSLVVLMGDFFQFAPVGGKALWSDKKLTPTEERGKIIWSAFTSVIILTEQMRQKSDPAFQTLLKRAQNATLHKDDFDTLNGQMATELPSSGSLEEVVVVVQRHNIRHITNCLSTELFVNASEQDIILFPNLHHRNLKKNKEIIKMEDILAIQDGFEGSTGPGLLPYSKGMPATVFVNQCTAHRIVNGTRSTMYAVQADPEG